MVKEMSEWLGDFPISAPFDLNPANVVAALATSKALLNKVVITKSQEPKPVLVPQGLDESAVENMFTELTKHYSIDEAEKKMSRRLEKYIADFPNDQSTQAVYQTVLNRIRHTKNEEKSQA